MRPSALGAVTLRTITLWPSAVLAWAVGAAFAAARTIGLEPPFFTTRARLFARLTIAAEPAKLALGTIAAVRRIATGFAPRTILARAVLARTILTWAIEARTVGTLTFEPATFRARASMLGAVVAWTFVARATITMFGA